MKIRHKEGEPSWLAPLVREMTARRPLLDERVIHVTQLLKPAHMLRLEQKHFDEMEADAESFVPALVGQAWHAFIEPRQNGGYVETEIQVAVASRSLRRWKLTGRPDWFDRDRIIDHKTTRVWSAVFGKPEWEEQLNIYRYLVHHGMGITPEQLEVHAVYLDWSETQAMRNPDLPRRRLEVLPVPVWPLESTESFIKDRLAALETPALEVCTPAERWERGEHWAAMKRGRKTALARCDTEAEAAAIAEQASGGYVEHRPGKPVRCLSWCSVRPFCAFGQKLEGADDESSR